MIDPADRDVVERQLGRTPRALSGVAHRCPCGQPDVVETAPRLEDGTPFPTLYYLTCPRASAAASRSAPSSSPEASHATPRSTCSSTPARSSASRASSAARR